MDDRAYSETTFAPQLVPSTPEVGSFVRRSIGVRFEMRFKEERQWWTVDAWDVAETLAGYYYDYGLHSCLEMMREGQELPTALAVFRVRRDADSGELTRL
jgi:hypothetical protein